jgi:hypothetical protein
MVLYHRSNTAYCHRNWKQQENNSQTKKQKLPRRERAMGKCLAIPVEIDIEIVGQHITSLLGQGLSAYTSPVDGSYLGNDIEYSSDNFK